MTLQEFIMEEERKEGFTPSPETVKEEVIAFEKRFRAFVRLVRERALKMNTLPHEWTKFTVNEREGYAFNEVVRELKLEEPEP